MKRFLFLIIRVLVFPFTLVLNEKVAFRIRLIVDAFYSAYLQSRFKQAPNLMAHGGTVRVVGGKYISLGSYNFIDEHVRLEAYDNYLGETYTPKITTGEHVIFNMFCHIGCINEIRIGNRVTIAERVMIIDHDHGRTTFEHMQLPPRRRPLNSKGPVVIEDYVSVGENCVITSGVTIGHNSFIGANAVVTKSVPPYSVVVGNPARVVKTVTPD